MNSLDILYFPGTALYSIRQYPFFLLFPKIHLIKPVEDHPADSSKQPTDSFIKSGFCQEHTPCPLGEDRDRFLKLIADLTHRRDDYAGQLSSLVLAAGSTPAAVGDETERAIITSMQQPERLQEKSVKNEQREKLWQARLLLAIGELLDREQEEIARNLAQVDEEQATLFKELHGMGDTLDDDGAEESPFAELNQIENHISAAHLGNVKKRFEGWKLLFQCSDLQQSEVFLTDNEDAGDLLLELYTKRTGRTALPLGVLDLPGLIGFSGDEALQAVVAFQEENRELLTRLTDELTGLVHGTSSAKEPATGGIPDADSMKDLAGEWCARLEPHFPKGRYGRIPLKMYLLQDLSCDALINETVPPERQNGLLLVMG